MGTGLSGIVGSRGKYTLYLSVGSRGGYSYLSYKVIEITNPEKFVSLCSRGSYIEIETLCSGWASRKLTERAAAEWANWER